MRRPSLTRRIAGAIEAATGLDGVAGAVGTTVAAAIPGGRLRGVLSGSWLGHPAHPFLVTVPIGCWTGASLLDLTGQRQAARALIGAGTVSVLPVALTGASDWIDTAGAERRVGLVHAAANLAATSISAWSWWARRQDRYRLGVGLAFAGAVVATFGGWLGGHLAYTLGVGVDTNAFEGGPVSWAPLGMGEDDPTDKPLRRDVAGVPLLVADVGGVACVLADRCSHRGAPLSEGRVQDGVVTCPWHGSRFALTSGEVVAGPAVVPQPAYQVRSVGGRLEVRRPEVRALRTEATRAGTADGDE